MIFKQGIYALHTRHTEYEVALQSVIVTLYKAIRHDIKYSYIRFTNTWAENEIKASIRLRENIAIRIFMIQSTKIIEGNLAANFSVPAEN